MSKSSAKSKIRKHKALEIISTGIKKKSKTIKSPIVTQKITLTRDADLYFHTQAAEEISQQLEHNRLYREEFENRLFHAIHEGQITAYSHRDGAEMSVPIHLSKPLCVKVNEVNQWLKNNDYKVIWNPQQNSNNVSDQKQSKINYKLLATRDQLIAAFGNFSGIDRKWFTKLKDKPALLRARKVVGKGGRNPTEPWFCPVEVMLWLTNSKNRVSRRFSATKGWELLEKNFPYAYNAQSISDPRDKD